MYHEYTLVIFFFRVQGQISGWCRIVAWSQLKINQLAFHQSNNQHFLLKVLVGHPLWVSHLL